VSTERSAASCENVHKTYLARASRVEALRGVTASFPRGALTVVAGPSGSGKSTLLRLLAGMDVATGGRIWVGGTPIHEASARSRRAVRARVGYVFQRPSDNYYPHLTLAEHVDLAARGARRSDVDAAEVLEMLGLGGRGDHRPGDLSGGEQARGAIAQALAAGAELVLADEPTAELDSHSSAALTRAVRGVVERGVTFVVASHDRGLVRHADARIALEHGVVRRPRRGREGAVADAGFGDVGGPDRLVIQEAASDAVLVVDGVERTFRTADETVEALVDVHLSVAAREIVGVVGRSGSGKTTLLNVVAGWDAPDRGRVVVAGVDPGRAPGWEEVAVVPQRLGLMPELTIAENVAYPARLAGRARRPAESIERLVEDLGLAGLENRYPSECSLGEQQRAAFARALSVSPRLLVADEPTAHQDAARSRAIFDAIRRSTAGGTACLVATHDPEILGSLDRTLTMRDGRIVGGPLEAATLDPHEGE
jgi:ABC-type lipoprotein export system ATPase subunit